MKKDWKPPSSPRSSSVVMSGIHLHKISCLAPLIPVMASDHFFPHRRFSHFIKDLLSDKNNNVLSPLWRQKTRLKGGVTKILTGLVTDSSGSLEK